MGPPPLAPRQKEGRDPRSQVRAGGWGGEQTGWNREISNGDPSSNQIPPTCPPPPKKKRVPKSLHEPRGLRLRIVPRGGVKARKGTGGWLPWPGDFTRWRQLQLSRGQQKGGAIKPEVNFTPFSTLNSVSLFPTLDMLWGIRGARRECKEGDRDRKS